MGKIEIGEEENSSVYVSQTYSVTLIIKKLLLGVFEIAGKLCIF